MDTLWIQKSSSLWMFADDGKAFIGQTLYLCLQINTDGVASVLDDIRWTSEGGNSMIPLLNVSHALQCSSCKCFRSGLRSLISDNTTRRTSFFSARRDNPCRDEDNEFFTMLLIQDAQLADNGVYQFEFKDSRNRQLTHQSSMISLSK